MIEEGDRGNPATKTTNDSVSRRNVLLGGTTLAAASAIASTGSVQTAQAQQRPDTSTIGAFGP